MSSAAFNDLIRQAAGRGRAAEPELELEPKVGRIGTGVRGSGGTGAGQPLRAAPTNHAAVNARIRRGASIVRSATVREGLRVDLEDPFAG
jgi:hypothetical protein